MAINLKDFNEVECELISTGYSSLEISEIWRNKKQLKNIFKRKEEISNLSLEELKKRIEENKKEK